MRIAASTRYQLWESRKATFIFYGVIYALMLLFKLFPNFFDSANGLEFASIIFIFIAGLNSFKETIGMHLQNGLSRRTFFWGAVFSSLLLAGILAVVDFVNILIMGTTPANTVFFSFYHTLFNLESWTFGLRALQFCMHFAHLALSVFLGFFITTLFYRMSALLKTLVSVGTGLLVIVIIPVLDATPLFRGRIGTMLLNFFSYGWGMGVTFATHDLIDGTFTQVTTLTTVHPWLGIVTPLVLCAVFAGLTWLLMRRASMKGQ